MVSRSVSSQSLVSLRSIKFERQRSPTLYSGLTFETGRTPSQSLTEIPSLEGGGIEENGRIRVDTLSQILLRYVAHTYQIINENIKHVFCLFVF